MSAGVRAAGIARSKPFALSISPAEHGRWLARDANVAGFVEETSEIGGRPVCRLLRPWAGHQLLVLEVDMTFTTARGVNLVELREALKLRPMSEFDPDKPARIYDNLNEMFFEWDPKWADHYRQTAGPYKGKSYEELTDYDGLELLGWRPTANS
jgi:hypothetical protein